MLHRLKTRWQAFTEARKAARELSPQAFARLAGEIRQLAVMAERLHPEEDAKRAGLARLISEVDQVTDLLGTQEFHRLRADKRRALLQGLLASRKQLLETVHNAPAPTDKLQ